MATVSTIINRALRLIGQLPSGESPSSDESSDALISLNAMLSAWNNEKLMCFAYQTETLTLANGDSSYTIGTSGDLNTTRPVEIVKAWITSSNQDYPMTPLSEAEYAAIFDKTASADWPDRYLYRPTHGIEPCDLYRRSGAERHAHLQARNPRRPCRFLGH